MKSNLYQQLLGRIEAEYRNGKYFEASWYIYAVLEDRLNSLLRQSGGEHYANNKPIRMMGKKLEEIEKRHHHHGNLKRYLTQKHRDDLNAWKDARNHLMHAMANAEVGIQDIDAQAEKLAKDGKQLARDYCSLCMKIKKLGKPKKKKKKNKDAL